MHAVGVVKLPLEQPEVVLPHPDDVPESEEVGAEVVCVEQGHEKHQLKCHQNLFVLCSIPTANNCY